MYIQKLRHDRYISRRIRYYISAHYSKISQQLSTHSQMFEYSKNIQKVININI